MGWGDLRRLLCGGADNYLMSVGGFKATLRGVGELLPPVWSKTYGRHMPSDLTTNFILA